HNAYDWAYAASLAKTGSSTKNDYLLANQGGQTAEIETVESVTGVHIDHFVETNLAGFYYLAQAFRGVEVCLKPEESGINPLGLQLGLKRGEVRRVQPEEGRRPVPAPVGAAGARVRARARKPGRGD